MRVAFITTHFPPSQGYGGVCESSFGLANGLVDAGAQVDVVTSDASLGGRIRPDAFQKFERANLRILSFPHLCLPKHGFSLSSRHVIEQVIRECDIAHINGVVTHPVHLGALISRRTGRKHVVSLRNGLDPWMLKQRRLRKALALYAYAMDDIRGASAIHATSQLEVQGAKSFRIPSSLSVIPNGFDPKTLEDIPLPTMADATWPALRNRRVLLFLSRLSPQKGLDMLLQEWDAISSLDPNLMLVIAGPDYNGYEHTVRRWIRQSRNGERVLLTGSVTGPLKWSLYARATLFVLPSYSENFGNVITEALAAGTPVVTTDATPWAILGKRQLGAVVKANSQAVREGVINMLSHSDATLKRMGAAGRRYVMQELTWAASGRKMRQLYEAILEGRSIPFTEHSHEL